MKSLKLILASLVLFMFTQVNAQEKSDKFNVAGECGMCKKKIESAAKSAGASFAEWDRGSKMLTVKYTESTDKAKIEQAIAKAGYDTPGVKATDEAYDKLDGCCKYERKAAAKEGHTCDMNCMKDGKCEMMGKMKEGHKCDENCMKDGKCEMMGKMKEGHKCDMADCKHDGKCDMAACNDKGKCESKDCCKKA